MASRSADVEVKGLRAVLRALKKLPESARGRVIKSSVSKAATIIVKAAKKLVPLGDGLKPDGTPREHLRNTITKTRAKVYKNGSIVVTIGPRFRAAPHSHLVDLGTKPHDITLTKPWLNLPAGTVIKHPGAEAAHFMDRAVAATQTQATAKMESSIASGIEREAAKLAGKK